MHNGLNWLVRIPNVFKVHWQSFYMTLTIGKWLQLSAVHGDCDIVYVDISVDVVVHKMAARVLAPWPDDSLC